MLRPYQLLGKSLMRQAFIRGIQCLIFLLPTGGGKTITFADVAKDAISAGSPTMVLCNRIELIGQADKKLKSLGLHAKKIIPGYTDTVANLYLASVDTLRNRKLPDIKLLIIDECHIRAFDEIALYYKSQGVHIIGCTATAVRKGKAFLDQYEEYKGRLSDIYEEIISPITITELISQDFLVPAITYGPDLQLDSLEVAKNEDGEKDYSRKSLFKAYNKKELYAGTVDNYLKFANGKKALVFNVNVEHSILTTKEFNLRGIASAHVDGKTPEKEREKIFERFRRGEILVLNNCAVATTGYDEPSIECIILNRATLSLSLYLQMCGRGSRPFDNKYHFVIIDQGNNRAEFGFWQEERTYSLDHEYISDKLGVAPVRNCENCEALIPMTAQACPYCEKKQEKQEEDQRKLLQAEFVMIEPDSIPIALRKPLHMLNVIELEQYREIKGYSVAWCVRQLIARGNNSLHEYAKNKKYSASWITKQLELSESAREKAKIDIWKFIQKNKHTDIDYIKKYSVSKLKANHSPQEIEILIPKIIEEKLKLS